MFLTRLPLARVHLREEHFTEAVRYYPLVGLLVGGVAAAAFAVGAAVGSTAIAAVLAVAATLLATGAFHEDGLADLFDGLGAATPERMLEIMRDSRLGTFGAAALFCVLALKIAALVELPTGIALAALLAAHGLSRYSAVLVIATSRYVRGEGTAKPVATGVSRTSMTVAAITALAILGGVALYAGWGAALSLGVGLVIGQILARSFFERRLGGYTGDCLGAVQQLSELGAYLALAAWA